MGSTTFSGPVTSDNGFIGGQAAVAAGAGITDGTGSAVNIAISQVGQIVSTQIFIDLTGLQSSTTDLDIIGTGTEYAYVTQVDFSKMGQLFAATLTCLEAPLTGVTSIDMYSGTEGTGAFDDDFSAITETILVTAGAAWTLNKTQTATPATDIPVDESYIYLANGAGGTVGTYTAGQLMLELFGYKA